MKIHALLPALLCLPPALAGTGISELRITQSGPEVDEYFELVGVPGTSLAGMQYVVVRLDSGHTGEVEFVLDLSSAVIPADGYFLCAESTMTLATPDMVANLDFTETHSVEHMLVTGQGLLVGDDVDIDDDYGLDGIPYSSVSGAMAMLDTIGGWSYFGFGGFGTNGVMPPHAFWCYDSVDTGVLDAHAGNDSPGSATPGLCSAVSYCSPANPNSTGFPVTLQILPNPGLGAGLHLDASGGPEFRPGYFLVGSGIANPPLVISDGVLCLSLASGNVLGRYNAFQTPRNSIGTFDASGNLVNLVGTSQSGFGFDLPLELPLPGGAVIQAGETWYFQLWYRDVDSGGNSSTNFSDAVSYTF